MTFEEQRQEAITTARQLIQFLERADGSTPKSVQLIDAVLDKVASAWRCAYAMVPDERTMTVKSTEYDQWRNLIADFGQNPSVLSKEAYILGVTKYWMDAGIMTFVDMGLASHIKDLLSILNKIGTEASIKWMNVLHEFTERNVDSEKSVPGQIGEYWKCDEGIDIIDIAEPVDEFYKSIKDQLTSDIIKYLNIPKSFD